MGVGVGVGSGPRDARPYARHGFRGLSIWNPCGIPSPSPALPRCVRFSF
jgi:hypothetical protein